MESMTIIEVITLATQQIENIQASIQAVVLDNSGMIKRSDIIGELSDVQLSLQKLADKAASIVAAERKVIEDKLKDEQEKLEKVKLSLKKNVTPPAPTIKPKAKESSKWCDMVADTTPTVSAIVKEAKSAPVKEKKGPINVLIAEGVYLAVHEIKKESDCHLFKGWWCWISATNKFYLSVNDEILYGTTTIIRDAKETPNKLREHYNSANVDYTKTTYYIPSELNPSSKDVRELSNRLKFVPASYDISAEKDVYTYRLGCKSTLKSDLVSVNEADVRLYKDITVNHMLVMTVAMREMRIRRRK